MTMIPRTSAKPYKTVHLTCRVDQNTASLIKSDAAKLEILPGTLLARIVQAYANWGRFEEQLEFVSVPRWMLASLASNANEEQMRELSSDAFSSLKNTVIFMTGKYDLKGCVAVFEKYGEMIKMPIEHVVNGNIHNFVLRHSLNYNWSIFIKSLWTQMFKEFVPDIHPEFEMHDEAVSIKIALGPDWNEYDVWSGS